jgi:hypothetical protein
MSYARPPVAVYVPAVNAEARAAAHAEWVRARLDEFYKKRGYSVADVERKRQQPNEEPWRKRIMHRPDPSGVHRCVGDTLSKMKTLRDVTKDAHEMVDAVNPATGAHRFTPEERRAEHQRIKREALEAAAGFGLAALDADVRTALGDARAYLEPSAIFERARFHRAPGENDSADATVSLELLEEMTKARRLQEVRLYDDERRAQVVAQAAREGNLALLHTVQLATDEQSRRKGAPSVVRTRAALVDAMQSVELPRFERHLQGTVDALESDARQLGAVYESLNADIPEAITIPERAAQVAAARERIAAIPIADAQPTTPAE